MNARSPSRVWAPVEDMVPMLLKFPEASILVVPAVANTPPPSIFRPVIVDAVFTSTAVVNVVFAVLNVQPPVTVSAALICATFAPSERSDA